MLRLFVFIGLFFSLWSGTHNLPSGKAYIRTEDGVILYPDEDLSGNTRALKIQVVADNIIRVIACPGKEITGTKSLITTYSAGSIPQWDLIPLDSQKITIKTKLLTVHADLGTGTLSFFDSKGNPILREKKMGRTIEPAVYEGKRSYKITQTFETTADDAYYGLGQHQDGLLNYKGYQVSLFQNNTEVAVPFLVSRKNYGILWDNYSLTKAGDTRDYKPLSALKLFSKDGRPGWLTASYSNDKNKPGEIFLERPESEIKYEYINDSKLNLPADFKPQNGVVTWEGSIASDLNGEHKLRFTYGGYIKVWLNGKLVLDRWRQSWNPCSAILNFNFEQAKKYPVKIEWIPNGSESYASLKWMEPADAKTENTFGFCSEAGKQLDYYFIYGNNIDEVIGGYRSITGKAAIVPKWALGLWQSRERYKTQDEILNTVAEFRKRKIPLDNIVLDWSYWKEDQWGSQEFEASRFPNPDSMIRVLHEKYNTHFMISVWPKFYEGIESYNQFDKKGWLYKRNIADRQKDWIGRGYVSTFYDAFNEEARKGFWNLINEKLYKKGIDAWWMDASEPDILSNVSPQKRKEQMYPVAAGITAEYLNAYPLENVKGMYEGQRSANPDQRVFILTRSAFAGLQRYGAATWSGDIASRWHDMKLQIPAGINFSMSGIPYWTMDIGGFAVEQRFERPDSAALDEWRELMTRWYQFGSFVPLFRVHGQFPFREIFNTAPENHIAYQSMLYYDRLRYRLMPYIYSLAGDAYHTNYTIMRGLVMDFPADKTVAGINDQYMFGPSLLINPVYNYQQRNRDVYLPAGQGWYDLYSGKYFKGGTTINADAPYDRMPVLVKEGSILPFGPALQYTGEKKADTITLCVYGGKDAGFSLYEDEETNYNYEKGLFATIQFNYTEKNKTLEIQKREGEFPGMPGKRFFRIVYINSNKPIPLKPEKNEGQMVKYNGSRLVISLQ
ncbi:MAG: glycoside hydrolase family 31 protein [Bacteroidota bacterium]|nr:glycoside hydrolase family 31 protein [Bacteroidota bacterium]